MPSESHEVQSIRLLLSAPSACKALSIGKRRLWSLSICNAIPSIKLGRSRRYCPRELAAWVAAGCPTEAGAADRVRKGMRRDST